MRLKEIREARGISQRQAALGLNLSPTVYNRYENGIREPSNALLLVLADYFHVSVDEILGREDPSSSEDHPANPRISLVARGMEGMTEDEQERFIAMGKAAFPEIFDKK